MTVTFADNLEEEKCTELTYQLLNMGNKSYEIQQSYHWQRSEQYHTDAFPLCDKNSTQCIYLQTYAKVTQYDHIFKAQESGIC